MVFSYCNLVCWILRTGRFRFWCRNGFEVLGKNDFEKRVYLNTIGPFWHANEVWLVCAGGAMFAAFPHWYATLFSGFYIPFVFMLLALILRGVSFKFRAKIDNHKWKSAWDWGCLLEVCYLLSFGELRLQTLW